MVFKKIKNQQSTINDSILLLTNKTSGSTLQVRYNSLISIFNLICFDNLKFPKLSWTISQYLKSQIPPVALLKCISKNQSNLWVYFLAGFTSQFLKCGLASKEVGFSFSGNILMNLLIKISQISSSQSSHFLDDDRNWLLNISIMWLNWNVELLINILIGFPGSHLPQMAWHLFPDTTKCFQARDFQVSIAANCSFHFIQTQLKFKW